MIDSVPDLIGIPVSLCQEKSSIHVRWDCLSMDRRFSFGGMLHDPRYCLVYPRSNLDLPRTDTIPVILPDLLDPALTLTAPMAVHDDMPGCHGE